MYFIPSRKIYPILLVLFELDSSAIKSSAWKKKLPPWCNKSKNGITLYTQGKKAVSDSTLEPFSPFVISNPCRMRPMQKPK